MKCPQCGNQINENEKVCPVCGAQVLSEQTEEPAASKGQETAPEPEGEPVVSPIAEPEQPESQSAKPRKKKGGMIAAIIAIAVIIAVIIGVQYYRTHFIAREINLGKKNIELITGETEQLNYEILPATTKNKEVTWTVDDASIAEVDENGKVIAIASGVCTVSVTTTNGKTDSCEVLVKDFVDIQKEAIDALVGYIDASGTTDESGRKVLEVKKNPDSGTFTITTDGQDLIMETTSSQEMEDMDVKASYATDVRLEYGNIETAEATQNNVVEICGVPVTVSAKGTLLLADYKRGDKIAFDTVTSTLEELNTSEGLHRIVNRGVKNCYDELSDFLAQHAELGITISDFGFVAIQPTDSEFSDVESDVSSVPAEAESECMSVESSVEDAYAPNVESVVQPTVESVAEIVEIPENAESTVEEISSAAEEVIDAAENTSLAEAVIENESTTEPVIDAASPELDPENESTSEEVIGAAASGMDIETESTSEDIIESAVESAAESVMDPEIESTPEAVMDIAADSTSEAVESAEEAAELEAEIPVVVNEVESAVESLVENVEETITEIIEGADTESMASSMVESVVESVVESAAEPVEPESGIPEKNGVERAAALRAQNTSGGSPLEKLIISGGWLFSAAAAFLN